MIGFLVGVAVYLVGWFCGFRAVLWAMRRDLPIDDDDRSMAALFAVLWPLTVWIFPLVALVTSADKGREPGSLLRRLAGSKNR